MVRDFEEISYLCVPYIPTFSVSDGCRFYIPPAPDPLWPVSPSADGKQLPKADNGSNGDDGIRSVGRRVLKA